MTTALMGVEFMYSVNNYVLSILRKNRINMLYIILQYTSEEAITFYTEWRIKSSYKVNKYLDRYGWTRLSCYSVFL